MEEINYDDIVFDIQTVINKLTKSLGIKFKLKNNGSPEYIATAPVEEKGLLDANFKFIGYSSYVRCPMYRLGNIEAIFDEGVLHIYDLRG